MKSQGSFVTDTLNQSNVQPSSDERDAAILTATAVAAGVSSLFHSSDTSGPELNTIADAIRDTQKRFTDLLEGLEKAAEKAKDAKSLTDSKGKATSVKTSTSDIKPKSSTTVSLGAALAAYAENNTTETRSPSTTDKAHAAKAA